MDEYNNYIKVIQNINVLSKDINDITNSLEKKMNIHDKDIAFLNNLLEESIHNFEVIAKKLNYPIDANQNLK